jgi:hypothetical protein
MTPGYDYNPACGTLFPWLTQISQAYERFMFHHLSFRVTPSQASSTAGRLYLATDYDYDDQIPSTKSQMMSNQTHQEGSVWAELKLSTIARELHADGKAKYISHNSRMNFVEPRTAYCGFLIVAVDTPTANLLFDLEVTYDVELFLPVLDSMAVLTNPLPVVGDMTPIAADWLNTAYTAGWVCRAIGRFCRMPANQGLFRAVTSGSNGVPALNFFGNVATPVPADGNNAIDLGPVGLLREGALQLQYLLSATGLTPSDVKVTRNVHPEIGLWDSLGNWLGQLSPYTTPTSDESCLMDTGSSYAVGGGLFSFNWAKPLASLFMAYPTAKYAVPVLATTLANAIATGGSMAGALRYSP